MNNVRVRKIQLLWKTTLHRLSYTLAPISVEHQQPGYLCTRETHPGSPPICTEAKLASFPTPNPLIVQQSTISIFETFVWIAPSPFLPFSWGKYRLQVSPQNNQTISASPFSPGEGESKFCKLSNMIPKTCRTRKGTSPQYQWCYLDLVIWYCRYLSG